MCPDKSLPIITRYLALQPKHVLMWVWHLQSTEAVQKKKKDGVHIWMCSKRTEEKYIINAVYTAG